MVTLAKRSRRVSEKGGITADEFLVKYTLMQHSKVQFQDQPLDGRAGEAESSYKGGFETQMDPNHPDA